MKIYSKFQTTGDNCERGQTKLAANSSSSQLQAQSRRGLISHKSARFERLVGLGYLLRLFGRVVEASRRTQAVAIAGFCESCAETAVLALRLKQQTCFLSKNIRLKILVIYPQVGLFANEDSFKIQTMGIGGIGWLGKILAKIVVVAETAD